MSNENDPPAGLGGLAFATQLPGFGGCGGCGGGVDSAGRPAVRPSPASLPLSQAGDAELLTTQPQVEVIDSRLEGHGRRAEVREGRKRARRATGSQHKMGARARALVRVFVVAPPRQQQKKGASPSPLTHTPAAPLLPSSQASARTGRSGATSPPATAASASTASTRAGGAMRAASTTTAS